MKIQAATLVFSILLTAGQVGAQAPARVGVPKPTTPTASFSQATPSAFEIIDESFALAVPLVHELRRGGYVIFMRHGPVQPGSKDVRGPGEWWQKCESTQRLASSALPQAQAVGQAIARQRIQIDAVWTSQFCRASDTAAFLGLSAPMKFSLLNDTAFWEGKKQSAPQQLGELVNALLAVPAAGKNRILVGHALPPNTAYPILSVLPESHTAIFRSQFGSGLHLVTVLSPGQWQQLRKQAIQDQPVVTVSGAPQVLQPAVSSTPPSPLIDPKLELKGLALLEALRKGGYNLYMRHAQSNLGADQDLLKTPMWWENCALQRNMSEIGKEQARKVGAAIRELKLPIAEVKAAQFCRTLETATLLGLGPIEVDEGLNHQIGQRIGTDINALRYKLLATATPKGGNVFMVSHTHGSARPEERVMSGIQEAEVIVFQPDGKGGVQPIARIPTAEWTNLIALSKNTKG